MSYTKWADKEEFKKNLTKISELTKIEQGGIPYMYEDKILYIDDSINHTLIIDSEEKNKNEKAILASMKLSIAAKENIIITDNNNELYKKLYSSLKSNNYNIVYLDFTNPLLGNAWNPLTLPYKLYKNNEIDKAINVLEKVGHYLFKDAKRTGDPFWTNSASDLFVGIAFYLFSKANEEEINLQSIFNIVDNSEELINDIIPLFKKILTSLDYSNEAYINLSSILKAPTETRGGIFAVFKQQIRLYLSRESLANQLSYTNFKYETNEKNAIFIISNSYTQKLVPAFIEQVSTLIDSKNKTNIILNNFTSIFPFENLPILLSNAKYNNIKYILSVPNYQEIENIYGKEEANIIELSCANLIYLITNDPYTLEKISELCGTNKNEPLISVQELKTIAYDEAIVLVPRMMPYKTKLIDCDDIDWLENSENYIVSERELKEIKIYDINKI